MIVSYLLLRGHLGNGRLRRDMTGNQLLRGVGSSRVARNVEGERSNVTRSKSPCWRGFCCVDELMIRFPCGMSI